MANSLQWLAENRVLYVRYFDEMTGEEINQLINETVPIIESGGKLVHIIVDYTANPTFELSLREIIESKEASLQFQHPSIGWTVAISIGTWQYFYLLEYATKTYLDAQMKTVKSIEDAVQFLHEQDASLPEFQVKTE